MFRLMKAFGAAVCGAIAGLLGGTVGVAFALAVLALVLVVFGLLIAGAAALMGLHWADGPTAVQATGLQDQGISDSVLISWAYTFFRITGAIGAIVGAWNGFRNTWDDEAPIPRMAPAPKRVMP